MKYGVFYCRVYKKYQFTLLTKTVDVTTNDGFPESIVFVQCTVYSLHWRNNALQTILQKETTVNSPHIWQVRKLFLGTMSSCRVPTSQEEHWSIRLFTHNSMHIWYLCSLRAFVTKWPWDIGRSLYIAKVAAKTTAIPTKLRDNNVNIKL